MRVLVTGAAGFIGTSVVARALESGASVIGLDRFSDYYSPAIKRENLASLEGELAVVETDILTADLDRLMRGVDCVIHLAAQAGVRASWRDEFPIYSRDNIDATQKLLESARTANIDRFVYASSSSVYGNANKHPVPESAPTLPHSPYGATKLAAEHLTRLYFANFGLNTVSLRFFTVYGPRQRPDMAMHRIIESALRGTAFPMFGGGDQIRDFTYVGDVAEAVWLAANESVGAGEAWNVAGGESTTLNDVIHEIEILTGQPVKVDRRGAQEGDVFRTGGATDLIEQRIGWFARTNRLEGLTRQVEWHRSHRAVLSGAPVDR